MTEEMELVGEDRELFLNALLNPPEPSDALRLAAERYKGAAR